MKKILYLVNVILVFWLIFLAFRLDFKKTLSKPEINEAQQVTITPAPTPTPTPIYRRTSEMIWLGGQNNRYFPYVSYSYKWEQKTIPELANTRLSCTGYYQLLINNIAIYHGPSFAVLPTIYYDTVDIRNNIRLGENHLDIICNYRNFTVWEHPTYSTNLLLVGGEIADGNETHYLDDDKLWRYAPLSTIGNLYQISNMTGFSETVSLPIISASGSAVIKFTPGRYIPEARPISNLKSEPVEIWLLERKTYDLKKFMVGYLHLTSNVETACQARIIWGGKLGSNSRVLRYFNQEDVINLPKGTSQWDQFSRRAGRYFEVVSNCKGNLSPKFNRISYPFLMPNFDKLKSQQDKQIYELSLNTLKNNVQDHLEDSVEREKAMYVGDSFTMSKCLLENKGNGNYVKEMIRRFALSQDGKGRIPANILSNKWQFIPGYQMQWVVWLKYYTDKTGDETFQKEMTPYLAKVFDWATKHESPEGFLYNPNRELDWWNFVDWTYTDERYDFSTSLQIWYYQALRAAGFDKKAERLKTNLQKIAMTNGLFVDSFLDGQKTRSSVLVNALAGKFDLFKNRGESLAASKSFSNLLTSSPYSQTWVVEWMINLGDKQKALELIRQYWGGMITEDMTTVYEAFNPASPLVWGYKLIPDSLNQSSLSHGWGCGPMFLYPMIEY